MLIKVYVLNWEKINARKDVNNPSWFKFKHKFFDDSDFFDFTNDERIAWLYLLCESSKQNKNGEITVNTKHFHHNTRTSQDALQSAIKKLKQLHIVDIKTLRGRYVDVTSTCSRQEKNRLEEIRKENTIDQMQNSVTSASPRCDSFDFEQIYNKYPRKLGKNKGLSKCKVDIKTQDDFALLVKSVERYSKHCLENKTEPQFIKHFSTFMTSWRDWIDPEVGKTNLVKPISSFAPHLSKEDLDKEFEEHNKLRKQLGLA